MKDWPITNVSQFVTRTTGETTTTSFPPGGDHVTDFSEYTTGGGVPGDWTKCWRTNTDTVDIVTSGFSGTAIGGKALESSVTAGWKKIVKWDDLDNIVSCDIYARVQAEAATNRMIDLVARGRGSTFCPTGSYTGPYSAYQLTLEGGALRIYAYDNETFGQQLATKSHGLNYTTAWVWLRFQVIGKGTVTLRAKAWQDGSPEPGSWDFDITDSVDGPRDQGGFIGFGSNSSSGPRRWCDYLSVTEIPTPTTTTAAPTTTLPPTTTTTTLPFGEWVDRTNTTWWTANTGSWNALLEQWEGDGSFDIRLDATAALRGPLFRPLKVRLTIAGTADSGLFIFNFDSDWNIIDDCPSTPPYTSLTECDTDFGCDPPPPSSSGCDLGELVLGGTDASFAITKIEFFVGGLTTTSTTGPPTTTTTTSPGGVWVQQFGLTRWVCLSNCTWDGDSYNTTGPGLAIRVVTGSWYVNYRPTHLRITCSAADTIGMVDKDGNAIAGGPVVAGPNVLPITWQGVDLGPSTSPQFWGRISNGAVCDIENIEFFEPFLISTTTTTTLPPVKWLVPDEDLSPDEWDKFGTCTGETFKFPCVDTTPLLKDDAGGIAGLSPDQQRFGFIDPEFVGISERLRAWIRVDHPDGDDLDVDFYDGAVLFGSTTISPATTGYRWMITEWISVAKTDTELEDLEIILTSQAISNPHMVSEVVIEIQQGFQTTTTVITTTSTSTTVPTIEFDEFSDGSIAPFWNPQEGLEVGADFTEAGGKLSIDSGPGIFPTPTSLWHPPQSGAESDVTWIYQEHYDTNEPDQLDFKVPFADRPPGWGSEGDTVGIVVWENDQRYVVICKTIRYGREIIQATHVRQDTDLTVVVRHRRVLHNGWPFYLRIQGFREADTGLGWLHFKTFYGEKPHHWIDLVPDFGEFQQEQYRTGVGSAEDFYKVGVFAHHGKSFPATSTTVTDPPVVTNEGWQDFTDGEQPNNLWIGQGSGNTWQWNSEHQAWILEFAPQASRQLGAVGSWVTGFRPTHIRITWDAHSQEIDAQLQVLSPSFTLASVTGPITKSPIILPLDFSGGEDINTIKYAHNAFGTQRFAAFRKIEFWTTPPTTTTTVTTTTGPPEVGGNIYRNQWNPADKSADLTLQNNNYDALNDNLASVSAWEAVRGFGKSSGKWYFEIEMTTFSGSYVQSHGVAESTFGLNTLLGATSDSWGYRSDQKKAHLGTYPTYGTRSLVQGDILGVAVDLDNGKLFFALNNAWMEDSDPVTGANPAFDSAELGSETIYPCASILRGQEKCSLFSQEDLTWEPPAGYSPWFSAIDGTTTTTTTTTV